MKNISPKEYKKISSEVFHKISSHQGLTLYDIIVVKEVLLMLFMKAKEVQEIYKMEAEISESVEEAIFAEGAKKGMTEFLDFIVDELNDFECPPSGPHHPHS